MKPIQRLSAGLLLLALLFLGACTHAGGLKPTGHQAKHAIILVIDGPRQSEMWAQAGRPNVPRMAAELLPQGVLLSGFRNNGPTYTSSGHTALCTSHYEDLENTKGSELPSKPSFFQAWRRASGARNTKAWVIASKDKLGILADSRDPAWHGRFQPSLWAGKQGKGLGSGYGKDKHTRAEVFKILAEHHPSMVLINHREPDSAGHSNDWPGYLEGLRDADAFAAELWAWLQSDPHYKDKTAFFVTHDHGRHLDGHKDGFVSHGDDCQGCRQIALLALGPDFKRGVELKEGGEQIDLAPTIAHLLGFEMPWAAGKPLLQLFQARP